MRLEIDGGVKVDNIRAAAARRRGHLRGRFGDLRQRDYAATIRAMRQQIALQQQPAVSSARGRA